MFEIASNLIQELAKFSLIAIPLILIMNLVADLLWGGK